jgi:hypothetical protein
VTNPQYPSLYQVNTRVWLTALSQTLGRPATLDDIPDAELDRWQGMGFDWIWFLSVWSTGLEGQRVSRTNAEWRKEFEHTLPDLREADIAGSGFAITAYSVPEQLGGDAALARLRQRLAQRGLKLMLDFVPNHMGLDHPWAETHPEYFVAGSEALLEQEPKNYLRVKRTEGDLILAYGRDPYFPGWPDTLQLDYSNPATQQAMIQELQKIASQCDGVRCDMAMLLLPEVFVRTWGRTSEAFWPRAIQGVREQVPRFCFMAEVYWNLEWTLQQQGFDFTYDKRLYDRLSEGLACGVRGHLCADMDYQNKLARFLENHDEPRAAATFPDDIHKAAAVLTFLSPGLRFFHQGQFAGCRKRISPHLVRAPQEPVNIELQKFYTDLLSVIRLPQVRNGQWRLLDCQQAWEGNWTKECFVVFAWEGSAGERLLVTINAAPNQSQCYVRLPFPEVAGTRVCLKDLLGRDEYLREGNDLLSGGLYLDMPPWGYHVFALETNKQEPLSP